VVFGAIKRSDAIAGRIDEENLNDISTDVLRAAKEFGLSDRRLAFLTDHAKEKYASIAKI
jgi:hypothetical protein